MLITYVGPGGQWPHIPLVDQPIQVLILAQNRGDAHDLQLRMS